MPFQNLFIINSFFAIGLDGQSPNDMEKERENGAFWGQNVRFGVRTSPIKAGRPERRGPGKTPLFLAVIRHKREWPHAGATKQRERPLQGTVVEETLLVSKCRGFFFGRDVL